MIKGEKTRSGVTGSLYDNFPALPSFRFCFQSLNNGVHTHWHWDWRVRDTRHMQPEVCICPTHSHHPRGEGGAVP